MWKTDPAFGTKHCNVFQLSAGKHGDVRYPPAMLPCLWNKPEQGFPGDARITSHRTPVRRSSGFTPSSTLLPRLQECTCRIRQIMFYSTQRPQTASCAHSPLLEESWGNSPHVLFTLAESPHTEAWVHYFYFFFLRGTNPTQDTLWKQYV